MKKIKTILIAIMLGITACEETDLLKGASPNTSAITLYRYNGEKIEDTII